MSTYSKGRSRINAPTRLRCAEPTSPGWGGLARGVPVVEAVEPGRVVADGAGEELDGIDVVVVQVVVEDRRPHVARRAVVDQVARRGHDRVVLVVDGAALAPVRPGARQELHRTERAR